MSKWTGGKFANGAMTAALQVALSTLARGPSSGKGEWIYPEGKNSSTDLNDYQSVITNGILGNRAKFIQEVNRENTAGYFNPSRGFFADGIEYFRQRFFGWAGDPLAANFTEDMTRVNHPMKIIAHSQGTLTVVNAVRWYGLSAEGLTFEMKSPGLSYYSAARAIRGAGGTLIWNQPWGDIANIYAPTLNPFKWLSGFRDLFCGMCRHTANGVLGEP